jgi:quercetin dioxygenase-like cupin family protein
MAASHGAQKLITGIRTSPSSAIGMDRTQKHHGRLAIPAKEGKLVSMGGFGVKFKISGDETNRAFSIVEHDVQPRTLVPPHLHHDTDEYSYVVEGQFGARIGDEILLAGPGDYILKLRGIPHTFWNPTDRVARLVEIISPAGFEKFFAEAGELFTQGPPEVERVGALAAKYNTTVGWNEWVSELTKKYKLKLFG